MNKMIQDIGPTVHNTYLYHYDFVKTLAGDTVLVTVINGDPAQLCVMDAGSFELLASYPLQGANGAMIVEGAPDGQVIVGSFSNGALYLLDLERGVVRELAALAGGLSFIFAVCLIGEDLYFGGYPGCVLYRLHLPNHEVTEVATIHPEEMYLRSIHVVDGSLLIGCGSHVRLYRFHIATGVLTSFDLGELEGCSGFLTNLQEYNGKLAARIESIESVMLCDMTTRSLIKVFKGFSQFIVVDEELYLFNEEGTYRYLEQQDRIVHLSSSFTVGWKIMKAARLEYDTKLSRMTREGELSLLSLSTNKVGTARLPLPAAASIIHTIHEAPTGAIYISGYQSGGLSIYDPSADTVLEYKGIEQVEGMVFTSNRAYLGAYPGAYIYAWDYEDEGRTEAVPKLLFQIGEDQDRPFAMAADDNRLFIGTIPDYGKLGGALTVYDVSSKRHVTYRHVIEDHSISALVIHPGNPRYVYGGTTIWGGLGQQPTQKHGKLFIWDTMEHKVQKSWIPLEGEEGIGCLAFDEEGTLWGVTRGTLFQMDPVSGELLRKKCLVDKYWKGHFWRGPFLRILSNGDILVNVDRTIYRLDKATLNEEVLCRDALLLAMDKSGDKLYFARSERLFSMPLN
ncbi:hypothetical protein [Paenibacillus lemnae]|uniref:WD40 repeat domain-containing protein n=1 Tax=Paenibacillus lemnae TaxID=1330551 RepID=A0A848M6N0_PAELE|nr:hypothetical protein [Paenibacillus lemnae]NMO95254.1 hypothetical protein [Paenibacillus lemnae]